MNTWNLEQSETIAKHIMNGTTVDEAKAKWAQGVINTIGPSRFDATEAQQAEYKLAKETLDQVGYYMECGYLYKK